MFCEQTENSLSDAVHEQGRDKNKHFVRGCVAALLGIMDVDDAAVLLADCVIIVLIPLLNLKRSLFHLLMLLMGQPCPAVRDKQVTVA